LVREESFSPTLWKMLGNPGTMKDLDETPQWFINSTCYETGRNWRFSQRHIGDWKFGHNFQQTVPISIAVAASAAISVLSWNDPFGIEPDGLYNINPATDEPVRPVKPCPPQSAFGRRCI